MNHLLQSILIKSWEHLEISFIALFASMLIAIPSGILLAKCRIKWLATCLLRFSAILQTVPGLALLALIIVFITFLKPVVNLPTTGIFPAIIVLILYALLPLLSNTYTGIKQVSPSMIEVSKAMGMKPFQMMLLVELPLSIPVILAGVRLALVWIVGMVTLTSLIGSGGLGDLILQGLRTMQIGLVLAGTLPTALMAVVFDWIFARLGNWLAPKMV